MTLETSIENKKVYNLYKNSWTGFVWYLLSNSDFQSVYGTRLWQFLPLSWRFWWLQEAHSCFMDNILLHNPDPLFVDKSSEINEWDWEIGSQNVERLSDVSNKLLIPCVRCPWGCTEFLHR